MARYVLCPSIALALVLAASTYHADAARPSESLLPKTTKAFVSVPNVDELRGKWGQTQLGELISDPAMQPFVEDVRRQLQNKLNQSSVRLGLTWDDLSGVYGGEVCLAMIQPDGDEQQHALVLLADVAGHEGDAESLLKKISERLLEKKAQRSTRKVGDVEMVAFTLPKSAGQTAAAQVFHYIHKGWLVASDHEKTAAATLSRLEQESEDTLQQTPPFVATMQRCREASGDLQPHIRWFVEPFGYALTLRAAQGGRKRRGTDYLKVLAGQGFQAIQGVGGYVMLATGEHEVLHRTMIYAPPVAREKGSENKDKYDLAARLLNFPNGEGLAPQPWIPRDLSTCLTFQCKVKEAFEYVKTLVNAVADDEIFEDVLDGIATDPLGPQVEIRKELVAHLGERITLMTDYRTPITPQSEQLLVAIDVVDANAVAQTINKVMETEPDAHKHEFEGHVIWEIINKPEKVVELKLEGPGFGSFVAEEAAPEEEEEILEEPLFANPAIAVVNGQLMFASQIDFIRNVLKQQDQRDLLSQAQDYQLVADSLDKLGAGNDSFRSFTRMDEAYRATYELIRQGKMPESESLLGKMLNRLLGSGEQGVLRRQQIDGAKMPEYQIVRRYLGPAGLYARSEENGWFVSGCVLNKDAE